MSKRGHWRKAVFVATVAVAVAVPLTVGAARRVDTFRPASPELPEVSLAPFRSVSPSVEVAPSRASATIGWSRRWSAAPARVSGASGLAWEPDTRIATGGTARLVDPEAAAQYRYARTGSPAYAIAVPSRGTYAVTLTATFQPSAGSPTNVLRLELESGGGRQQQVVESAGTGDAPRHLMFLAETSSSTLRFGIADGSPSVDVNAVAATLVRSDTGPLSVKFADDFDGPAGSYPDARWRPQLGATGWGNDELQDYTASTDNASLTGTGRLSIAARREAGAFTSARLRTAYEGTYGRIEGVIRVPNGAGLLPAFWLLGADVERSGWPQCGEVDLLESLGVAEPGLVHGTVHGPDGTARGWETSWSARPAGGPAGALHTYALDWWPGVLQWSVDGVVHGVLQRSDLRAGHWVFEKPAFLLLNVAVGGRWSGLPPASTVFPQVMQVESVRWLG
jgi:beta-glucanase (GH16 family)